MVPGSVSKPGGPATVRGRSFGGTGITWLTWAPNTHPNSVSQDNPRPSSAVHTAPACLTSPDPRQILTLPLRRNEALLECRTHV